MSLNLDTQDKLAAIAAKQREQRFEAAKRSLYASLRKATESDSKDGK